MKPAFEGPAREARPGPARVRAGARAWAPDAAGAAAAAAFLALLLLYRHVFVEPREWGAACAAAAAPAACGPRAALLWMQYQGFWGGIALLLGVWAFVGSPLPVAVAAVAFGAAGTVNYNATFGMLGAVLGAWAWLRRPDRRPDRHPAGDARPGGSSRARDGSA